MYIKAEKLKIRLENETNEEKKGKQMLDFYIKYNYKITDRL